MNVLQSVMDLNIIGQEVTGKSPVRSSLLMKNISGTGFRILEIIQKGNTAEFDLIHI